MYILCSEQYFLALCSSVLLSCKSSVIPNNTGCFLALCSSVLLLSVFFCGKTVPHRYDNLDQLICVSAHDHRSPQVLGWIYGCGITMLGACEELVCQLAGGIHSGPKYLSKRIAEHCAEE